MLRAEKTEKQTTRFERSDRAEVQTSKEMTGGMTYFSPIAFVT